jgi:hypothetical protein
MPGGEGQGCVSGDQCAQKGLQIERDPREPVRRAATLTLMDGDEVPAVMTNVSETGAQAGFDPRKELSCVVRVSGPAVAAEVFAEVVWQGEGVGGLQFLHVRK